MITLRVLGGVSLELDDGTELRAITAQPKRIALLSYLAIASQRTAVRRDTILALFWPELDTDRARHALRQAIYHVRRELGADVLAGNGDDELRINREALACDAVEFTSAIGANQHQRALELYRGELLPGLYITGASEFEQWLATERARLQQGALAATGALCIAAQEAGRKDDVVRWAHAAHQLAPFDEPVLRRLLDAHVAAGDGASAVLAYETFADRLARELGVAPAGETRALIEQVRARGAATLRRKRHGASASELSSATLPTTESKKSRWGMPLITTAAISLLLFSGLVAALVRSGSPRIDPDLIAILPFRVLGSPNDSLVLADGIPELLALDVQAQYGPRVVDARAVANRWREASQSAGRNAPDLARDVARSVGAGRVLQGSAFARGAITVLTASVVDVRSGDVQAKATVQGPSAQLVHTVDRLGTRVLATILNEDPVRLEHLTSTSFEAVQAYLEGKAAGRRGEYDVAFKLLSHALEIDSTFALAALALVDVGGWSSRGQAEYLRIAYRNRNRLGVRDAAYLRAWMGTSDTTGRVSSGDLLRATEQALKIVPDRPEVYYLLGDRYYHAGSFIGFTDAARRSLANMEKALVLDPDFAPAREHLVELAVELGDVEATRRYRDLMLAKETGPRIPYLRWLAAQRLRDANEQRIMRAALDTMPSLSLSNIVLSAQEMALGLDDAEHAANVLIARATTNDELNRRKLQAEQLRRNRGRYAAADSVRPYVLASEQTPLAPIARVLNAAVFGEIVPRETFAAVAELQRRIAIEPNNEKERGQQIRALHLLEGYKLLQADTSTVQQTLARLRALPGMPMEIPASPDQAAAHLEVRVATLEAMLEHLRARGRKNTARPALLRLDSLARDAVAPEQIGGVNMLLIRMFRDNGDFTRGLAASRRRLRSFPFFHAIMLREEARFAAATGDRAGALKACEMYLALRPAPDPLIKPQVDSVRADYRRLKRRWRV